MKQGSELNKCSDEVDIAFYTSQSDLPLRELCVPTHLSLEKEPTGAQRLALTSRGPGAGTQSHLFSITWSLSGTPPFPCQPASLGRDGERQGKGAFPATIGPFGICLMETWEAGSIRAPRFHKLCCAGEAISVSFAHRGIYY